MNVVDSAGNVQNNYDYDIYGMGKAITENGLKNPVRYAGEYFDEESGLYYLRGRYYNPDTMRFISEDSVRGEIGKPLTLNLYAYCGGNPIKYVDPSGHVAGKGLDDPGLDKEENEEVTEELIDPAKGVYNFLIGDAIKTLKDPDASTFDKGLALASLVPAEKALSVEIKGIQKTGVLLLKESGNLADHHIIPKFRGKSKAYADFIKKLGIDVDEYTVTLSHGKGSQHLKFIHGEGKWNQKWMDWIDNHPNATAKDVFQFAGKMMDEFGIGGNAIHPYRKK